MTVQQFDRTKMIAPGARVEVRGEEWIVKNVKPVKNGFSYKVVGVSELVRDHEVIFLSTLDDVIEIKPEDTQFVLDKSSQYRKSRLYIEALLRKTAPIDDKIYTGHQGAFNLAEYQLKPAHLALTNLRPRVLIADAVGLGKTIEAGILLSELIKRGRGDRILVVTMKSMLSQFQQEMWARFTIPLVRLDSVGIQKVRSKIPSNKNPFNYFNRAIISVDTLKSDSQYRTYLEQCHWDAIVIDECHNVANANTQRNRLASLLARTCDSLILLSATPHNGKPESFAQLVNMLEPTAIADEYNYTHEEIQGLFTRRFKKDIENEVSAEFRDREVHKQEMPASIQEERFFQYLHSLKFNTLDGKTSEQLSLSGLSQIRGTKDTLFKNTLFKAFLSSPAACLHTVQQRIKRIEQRIQDEQATEEILGSDLKKLKEAESLLLTVSDESFSKYRYLKQLLEELKWTGKKKSPRILVFSERIQTLQYLSEKLRKDFGVDEKTVKVFHAGMSDIEQQEIVEDFGKEDSPVRILLASDVASEGVNLHYFCNHLIHFDIPWSLITLEQRNGRIDRYGQKHTPHIYYLITKSGDNEIKGDLRIVEKLIEKEEEAYKNLGDPATILRLYDSEKEAEYIEQQLAEGKDGDTIFGFSDDPMDIFGDLDQLLQQSGEQSVEIYPKANSYQWMDDYTFFEQSLNMLIEENISQKDQVEISKDNQSIVWFPPEDVQQILDFIPKEAIPKKKEFHLTINRDQVQKAIAEARKKQGRWPAKQLLWEQHPLFSWLVERVIVKFDKNEAPLMVVPHLNDRVIFFMQGVMFNKRAQPVISQWFGVEISRGGEHTIHSFDELKQLIFSQGELYNLGNTEVDIEFIHEQKITALETAKNYLQQLRSERKNELYPSIRKDQQKLKDWRDKKLELLDEQEGQKRLPNGTLAKHIATRIEHERRTVTELYKQRIEWITQTMTTDNRPFLRIAAVFVGK
ncbi:MULTISPECIES: helicase-related protein [Bacillus cereus group]|uniref:helicase-related protein n=1 Tax=Bacillus cereus group TaxID=86661 RepID=UPI00202CBC1E|nr:helicase-related protein [Bacillus cereus group sp. BcHK114]MCM0001663.1 DEAD/DEAH box helicase [Bacillus paranthracis]MDA1953430.1 helicase-related protein [Bacillus cereus group sp. BcHK114]